MTEDELYRRANEEMTRCYESGIRCMDESESKRSVRFFRDYTQGEIEAIACFSQTMYLAIIYTTKNDETEDSESYKNYCNRIRERSNELKDLIIQYAVRFL